MRVTDDITERKRAEEALRGSQERYRLVADNSRDLIGLLDIEGRIPYASPSHSHVPGYTSGELVDDSLFQFVYADDRRAVVSAVGELHHSRRRKTIELRPRKKSGDWLATEAILSPIADAGGAVNRLLFTARDVTERKRAERV